MPARGPAFEIELVKRSCKEFPDPTNCEVNRTGFPPTAKIGPFRPVRVQQPKPWDSDGTQRLYTQFRGAILRPDAINHTARTPNSSQSPEEERATTLSPDPSNSSNSRNGDPSSEHQRTVQTEGIRAQRGTNITRAGSSSTADVFVPCRDRSLLLLSFCSCLRG